MNHRNRALGIVAGALLFVSATQAPAASAADKSAPYGWTTTWAASPTAPTPGPEGPLPEIKGQTVRQRMRVSVGGDLVRVQLSNEFGTQPLVIGSATVALPTDAASIQPATLRKLTFGGRSSITIPPGAPVVSDPVELKVAANSDVAVSIYTPAPTPSLTLHLLGLKTAIITPPGDFTERTTVEKASTTSSHPIVSAIHVPAAKSSATVVALGDSITDGTTSTVDADHRWPDFLAQRLAVHNGDKGRQVAVVNQGISGNQLLRDGAGISALARFDRDVLAIPGVTHVIVLEGINDIGWPGAKFGTDYLVDPSLAPTAEDLIGAYRQLISRAHAHGLKIYGATLTPFEDIGFGYYSPEKEKVRQAVNQWIRTSKEFDAVIDFDAVVRDPAHPSRMLPKYDSGDHLHPGDDGLRAMGEAVSLALFNSLSTR